MSGRELHRRAFWGQKNIVGRLASSQVTGRGHKSVTQLPPESLRGINGGLDLSLEVYDALDSIEQCARQDMPDTELVKSYFQLLLHYLWGLQDMAHDRPSFKATVNLLLQTSYPSIVTIVMAEELIPNPAKESDAWEIKSHCMKLLHAFHDLDCKVAKSLAIESEFVQQCFRLLSHPVTCCFTSWFMCRALLRVTDTLRLVTIPYLCPMLADLDASQLAQFCPVLAETLEDSGRCNEALIADNARLLLHIDGLEEKMAEYCKKPSLLSIAGGEGDTTALLAAGGEHRQLNWPNWVLLKVKVVRLALVKSRKVHMDNFSYVSQMRELLEDYVSSLQQIATSEVLAQEDMGPWRERRRRRSR